ncbi:RNA polymerase sigma-70 factor [Sphingobacterium sp. DN00404]|uniref:RNA polymerase sigma-70 factor n=1 Tax=Sphingobacterium micropteri TaxID=2763501 RepID=A0ABR7YL59_9SPHI|nr:RNA polymerase sigma-70 factor [Sphingobacterium micropteri]MBD1432060.1 RNA polymerase sigma-70 factor [Sphingobacterium micropteri]
MLDTICVQNIACSDYKAFSHLYDKYWDLLLSIARKKTGNIDVSMDIVQDLFVDLWQRRSSLPQIDDVRRYLISSLYFKVFMHFRHQGIQQRHVSSYITLGVDEQEEDFLQLLEGEIQHNHLINIITESVEDMPERMRQVFSLKYHRSLSNLEIAETMGISVQTVKNQLMRSLQHIRNYIPEHLSHPTAFLFLLFLLS